ncbi:uncharacterized protein LOC127008253 [Eriocheir sinensis]|uniref:uncharacterized protein LOC127008253 n=1 Tax=Eriocheir sinensis TaxID=95602 RepID=UPI0021C9A481|nr:uncharacterized protein LOC127008253 [Eriocheir sinensis]
MSDPDLRDLQTAILTFDPGAVRSALDCYDPAGKKRPWCYEDGSTPLHIICKSGPSYIPSWPTTDIHPDILEVRGEVEWEPAPTPPAPPWSEGGGGEWYHRRRMCVVYMLCDAGVEVNAVDGQGRTPLHLAARRGDAALCDALLQCGADLEVQHKGRPLWLEVAAAAQREKLCGAEEEETEKKDAKNNKERAKEEQREKEQDRLKENQDCRNKEDKNEECCPDCPLTPPSRPPRHPAQTVWRLVRFYWPGLWRAVVTEDVNKVRQLINTWCKVDLTRGGVTLLEAAQGTANETITSLLHSIQPSLALVHSCLANNLPSVRALLASPAHTRLNLDIRRLSERAAPLLYFVVRAGHHHIASELCQHGASCLAHMLPDPGDGGVESAVVFEALEPWLPPAVVTSLLPHPNTPQAQALARVCGRRGGSVLRVAIEKGVAAKVVEAIVCVGGAGLVCERDPAGHTPHDLALCLGQEDLADLLDRLTLTWLTPRPAPPALTLALGGYGRLRVLGREGEGGEGEVERLMKEYERSQVFLRRVYEAVAEGVEVDALAEVIGGFHSDAFHMCDLLWMGRLEGDGMPLLHWAVLHAHLGALQLILHPPPSTPPPPHPPHTTRFCPDEVRDPWRRTPLHYALGLPRGEVELALAATLLDTGCSEHTLDMYGREPLDFQDVRGSPAMENLLENLRNKVYKPPNPDPWDPEVLRSHLEHLRRQRYQHHHHHNHHHHHQQQQQQNNSVARFTTPPGSDFNWPLPAHGKEEDKEEEEEEGEERGGGWRVCSLM